MALIRTILLIILIIAGVALLVVILFPVADMYLERADAERNINSPLSSRGKIDYGPADPGRDRHAMPTEHKIGSDVPAH